MAQPGNPIGFAQDTNFYECRSCRNLVLTGENYLFEDAVMGVVICKDPANVRGVVVESDRRRNQHGNQSGNQRGNQSDNQIRVLNVSCNSCHKWLAYKLVGHDDVAGNSFAFFLNRLLYWNGNQLVYADTQEPAENN